MNKFTLLIHNKGWKVQDACDYWGIHYDTYNKRCNSAKFHNQLECMCMGLESPLDREVKKAAKQLRKDMESAILGSLTKVALEDKLNEN